MDLFVDAHRWKGEGGKKDPITTPSPYFLPGNYQTYPATIKFGRVILYLKEIQKVYKSHGTFHEFC